jgi:hypothetical protein
MLGSHRFPKLTWVSCNYSSKSSFHHWRFHHIPPTTYEIPPFEIPPIVIPGFPMLPGGGGGGGGYGMGQGGYLFEETWAAGGDADPFGIGGMNFDAASMMGIPKGKRSKRRRR